MLNCTRSGSSAASSSIGLPISARFIAIQNPKTNCPTAHASTVRINKKRSVQTRIRFEVFEAINDEIKRIMNIAMPAKFRIANVRLTTKPANSRCGRTANALCATAIKNSAAPSQSATRRSLISDKNFISFLTRTISYYHGFSEKGQNTQRPERMTVAEGLRDGAKLLQENTIAEPEREAVLLMGHALKRDRTFIYANPEYRLNAVESILFKAVLRRRAAHEPFQYIVGRQEF